MSREHEENIGEALNNKVRCQMKKGVELYQKTKNGNRDYRYEPSYYIKEKVHLHNGLPMISNKHFRSYADYKLSPSHYSAPH